jgi:deoxycytidylate deaminase
VVDEPHGRDFARGEDSNDRAKCELIADVALRLSEISNVSMSALSQAIRRSRLDDITEYGRVVHAEMEALLSCARNGLSTRGTTMYCTTFPCHNCAKHIIAAGVERVVYVEPYPKSKALAFHDDASYLGFFDRTKKGVAFEPFFGVGPRRFFDLFSMNQGAGYALRRKDRDGGNAVAWREEDGVLRTAMVPWSYYQREELAARSLEGERHVEE